MTRIWKHFSTTSDPRRFQIAALGLFLLLQSGVILDGFDFGAPLHFIALTCISALAAQWLWCSAIRLPFDPKSPLITSFSLALLLKTNALWALPLAAILAISSKFTLRYNEAHLFNPANFAIVALLLLLPEYVWLSPGQWGSSIVLAILFAGLAFSVLRGVRGHFDTGLLFFICWSAALIARAVWLGDPLDIALHQLQNGAFLLFAFFMISDPKAVPNHRVGRILFALLVSAIAFILTFVFQLREALFYALFMLCAVRPLFDRIWRAPVYLWPQKQAWQS